MLVRHELFLPLVSWEANILALAAPSKPSFGYSSFKSGNTTAICGTSFLEMESSVVWSLVFVALGFNLSTACTCSMLRKKLPGYEWRLGWTLPILGILLNAVMRYLLPRRIHTHTWIANGTIPIFPNAGRPWDPSFVSRLNIPPRCLVLTTPPQGPEPRQRRQRSIGVNLSPLGSPIQSITAADRIPAPRLSESRYPSVEI